MWAHQVLDGTHISSCKLPEHFHMCTHFPLWKETFLHYPIVYTHAHTFTYAYACTAHRVLQNPVQVLLSLQVMSSDQPTPKKWL